MRAVLIGAVESSRTALERISAAEGWSCPLVVTLPLENAGRHSDFVDLTSTARSVGAELLRVSKINSPEALSAISEIDADAVFVVGWSQICGEDFRAAARQRVIGYHPAPLPRLRGRGVIPWTILNREPISGGTLFWIDDGVDSGPILAQRFFHVAPDETAAGLYHKHMVALSGLMDEALAAIATASPPRIVQDERYATFAARRTPADGMIDWAQPAEEIARLVRAVGKPYPGAQTFDGPNRVIVWEAEAAARGDRYSAAAGQVVQVGPQAFAVMCGDGRLLQVGKWDHPEHRCPPYHARLSPTPALDRGKLRSSGDEVASGSLEARRA